jgi:hypothetical protein
MAAVLSDLRERLADPASTAGFELVEQVLDGKGPWWLQYRRDDWDGRILLELSDDPAAGTLTADLWRPARLPEVRQQIWSYRTGGEPRAVAAAVGGVVAGWLQELAR